jgi:hypothetical protein
MARRYVRTLKRTRRLGLIVGTAAILLAACACFRISSTRDLEAYAGMVSECHPVWKLFALRRFGPGDSVERLFRKFPPTHRQEFGRYGVYSFDTLPSGISFTGFGVVTRDGKLLSADAGSCNWCFTFFNIPDSELNRQYAVYAQERHVQITLQRLEEFALQMQRFRLENERWPTNEGEFAVFITGKKPTVADLNPKLAERSFRRRYGLEQDSVLTANDFPTDNLTSYNPFGITIVAEPDQRVCIAYTNEPALASMLHKPRP